jgi:hypothetical protein
MPHYRAYDTGQSRPIAYAGNPRWQRPAGRNPAVSTPQEVSLILRHGRLERRQLDDLVAMGVEIRAVQLLSTPPKVRRRTDNHLCYLSNWE